MVLHLLHRLTGIGDTSEDAKPLLPRLALRGRRFNSSGYRWSVSDRRRLVSTLLHAQEVGDRVLLVQPVLLAVVLTFGNVVGVARVHGNGLLIAVALVQLEDSDPGLDKVDRMTPEFGRWREQVLEWGCVGEVEVQARDG